MAAYKSPDFAERTATARAAKQSALDKLRNKPAPDPAAVAQRQAAAVAREAAAAERRIAKQVAVDQAKAAKLAMKAAARKQMGILALKAMARRPWPEGARKTHEKCWYEPLDDAAAAAEGLRFTLSHPVTAAIPPGDENLFALALDLAAGFQPLSASEAEAIKQKGLATTPIFRS